MLLANILQGCVMFGLNIFDSVINNNPPTTNIPTPPKREIKSQQAETLTKRMFCRGKFLDNGDSLKIFLELEIPRLAETNKASTLASEFSFAFGLLPNYSAKEYFYTQKLNFNATDIKYKNNMYYVDFSILKKPTISSVMVLEITDTRSNDKIVYDMMLYFTITKVREKFAVFDKKGEFIQFNKYFLDKDTFLIQNLTRDKVQFYVKYYAHEFDAALPPMNTQQRLANRELLVDSTFKITTNQPLNFTKTGLYFLQADTTAYHGITIFVSNKKYPKLSQVNDLVEPLIYISTEIEIKDLKKNPTELKDSKKEMDKFWLKLSQGNSKLAKYIIKNYYQRVKYANQYFTTYKEGWKTDMGMIYIIYGAPNRTVRTNDAEYWFYTQNANFSEIKFSFAKKPNQFTDEHYNLVRFQDYEQVWYPMIEQWRNGKI